VKDCQSDSSVNLHITLFRLKDGTTLKEFYQGSSDKKEVNDLIGSEKNIETRRI